MQTDELLAYIFERRRASPEFVSWLKTSKRFHVFVENHRDKIRKKVRNVENDDGLKDIYFELEIAALLLNESRFTLQYEKYAITRQRGPDFTVTFKTHTPFNVEARRIRGLDAADRTLVATRLTDAVCDKVKQMPPGIVNVLALTSAIAVDSSELTQVMVTLRTLAEGKVEAFFVQRRFESATEFIRHYHHLSGILYRSNGSLILWANPLAKHNIPREIANILPRL